METFRPRISCSFPPKCCPRLPSTASLYSSSSNTDPLSPPLPHHFCFVHISLLPRNITLSRNCAGCKLNCKQISIYPNAHLHQLHHDQTSLRPQEGSASKPHCPLAMNLRPTAQSVATKLTSAGTHANHRSHPGFQLGWEATSDTGKDSPSPLPCHQEPLWKYGSLCKASCGSLGWEESN